MSYQRAINILMFKCLKDKETRFSRDSNGHSWCCGHDWENQTFVSGKTSSKDCWGFNRESSRSRTNNWKEETPDNTSLGHIIRKRDFCMALVGYELVIVIIILVVIFFWGPKKLPELAKSLAEARKEFRKVASERGTELEKN